MAELSEMELVILGNIFKMGPCTSYAVSREFTSSPTTHFSGSVGAIYPAVARLLERGLLRATEGARGNRPRVTYSVTRKGKTALRRWLTAPLPDSAVRIVHDPIRVRAFFLSVLKPEERLAFVEEADARVRQQYEVLESEVDRLKTDGDEFSLLAMQGMFHVLEARLKWLAGMRDALSR